MAPEAWHRHCHGFGWWKMRSQFSFQHSRETGHEWERKLSGCLLHTASDTIDRYSLHQSYTLYSSPISLCLYTHPVLLLIVWVHCSLSSLASFLSWSHFLSHTACNYTHILIQRTERGGKEERAWGEKEWMCEKEGRRELHQYVSFQFYSPEPRHCWHPL